MNFRPTAAAPNAPTLAVALRAVAPSALVLVVVVLLIDASTGAGST